MSRQFISHRPQAGAMRTAIARCHSSVRRMTGAASFLTRLWKRSLASRWRCRTADWCGRSTCRRRRLRRGLYRGHGELFKDAYREGIWKSKINLSFLTHSNHDEFAHKSFEIAACGGFLLVERSDGHLKRFVEDEEAVFFSTIEECAEKIRRYLSFLTRRHAREDRGCGAVARAERSGYHNWIARWR